MTTVAIHQPNYLPWLGFFHKMAGADAFVFLDDAPFTKNGYQNRVQIKAPAGPHWLTQPVRTAGRLGQPTTEVRFADDRWVVKHIRTIRQHYARSPHGGPVADELHDILGRKWERLAELNTELIMWVAGKLGLQPTFIRASTLDIEGTATPRLVQICRAVGADCYLHGQGGATYQDQSLFAEAGIDLRRDDFVHPRYTQLWGDFVGGLSIVDLLCNCGPGSRTVLLGEVGGQ